MVSKYWRKREPGMASRNISTNWSGGISFEIISVWICPAFRSWRCFERSEERSRPIFLSAWRIEAALKTLEGEIWTDSEYPASARIWPLEILPFSARLSLIFVITFCCRGDNASLAFFFLVFCVVFLVVLFVFFPFCQVFSFSFFPLFSLFSFTGLLFIAIFCK